MAIRTDKNTEQQIIKQYLKGVSNKDLARNFNVNRGTIQQILLRNSVELHKRKTNIQCNKKFFKTYTKSSCYWAGFILADGMLRKNRNSLEIHLALDDAEHLNKFLIAINCADTDIIKKYESSCRLSLFQDEFKNDLINNFDITPQKTYTATISKKIPEKFIRDFIRGYFDGDGCVTKTTTLAISFTGTVEVLKFLQDIFFQWGIRLKSKNLHPPITNLKNNVGAISYSGKNATQILNHLYKNTPPALRLDRKFSKYKQLKIVPKNS